MCHQLAHPFFYLFGNEFLLEILDYIGLLGKMDKKYDEYLCIELIYISLFIIIIDMVKKMLFLYFF